MKRRIIIILPFVIFSVYLFSLCPTVYLIDSGELAAVSYTLGIAHPTGYPLYTLISYFIAHIPGEPIFCLNLLSAVLVAGSAIFLYIIARRILKDNILSIIPVAIYSYAPTIWRISITNEVYPLTALFALIIIYFLYRMRTNRDFFMIMFLTGLAFTNHIIIFSLTLPIFIYLVVVYRPKSKHVILAISCALLAISLYCYLIARTLGNAELAWGNTNNMQRLIWHITGKQYRVWMFSQSIDQLVKNTGNGINILLRDFLYVLIVPVILGFYSLFKSERKKFWLFLAVFLLNLLYVINYSIPDIESYYIPGFVALIVVLIYGIKILKKYIKPIFALIITVLTIALNYRACTLRNNSFAMDFSRGHLEQLPANSLLLCSFWDIYSPTLYLDKVKGEKQNLIIIDKPLLKRTWYITYIANEYPDFCESVKSAMEDYLIELRKFEYDQPYNPSVIQLKYIKLLESFVRAKLEQGVYFAMPFPDQDLKQILPGYLRIPRGLVFEIKKDTMGYKPFDFDKLVLKRPSVLNDERLKFDITIVESMIRKNIAYLNAAGQKRCAEQAEHWLEEFLID